MNNREIKFRVWDEEKKIFLEQDYVNILALFNLFNSHKKNSQRSMPKTIWQQYTGLKDKNNKEIYEGDILKQYLGKTKLESKLFWRVEYFTDRCSFGVVSGKCFQTFEDALFDDECRCEFEIIGNIFENPELLKN